MKANKIAITLKLFINADECTPMIMDIYLHYGHLSALWTFICIYEDIQIPCGTLKLQW